MKLTLFVALVLFVLQVSAAGRDIMSPSTPDAGEIKNISQTGANSGFVFTGETVYRTLDGGASWREMALPGAGPIVSAVFADGQNGFVIRESFSGIDLLRTSDGGERWSSAVVRLPNLDQLDTALNTTSLEMIDGILALSIRIATSSNFEGSVIFRSADRGATWEFVRTSVEMASGDETPVQLKSGSWSVMTEGHCEGFKVGCFQEHRLLIDGVEKTPQQISAKNETSRAVAKAEAARHQMFALPPGGTTRISLNRGFDKCQAGSVAQMQTWWNTSPHFDSNIYFSGRNRACPSQPVNTAWVNSVTAMGWGLIPTVVGYQSPCTSSATTVKLSYDPAVAENQGRGEADIAVTDATAIGLTAGSIIYYDMERYDPPNPDTLGCRAATVAFLKGWTERTRQLGYQSGVYGSPKNAQEDWQFMPAASRMDAIWMARWDNVMSVWTYVTFPTFPTNVWNNHQRIKQWQAPHNETWGGVTFNIDGNISDAPVAGNLVPKNKNADFDGDGKTDLSVFRPEGGIWYVLNSISGALTATPFGSPTDVIAPGDYDGDGKTDQAIFRPSNGYWFTLGKAGVVGSRQFGQDGDIPVPGDYNNDGKTDMAVFRPSNGVWYIANSDSLGTYTFVQFGATGDKPVQADYDGDGKIDIAVWRPATGDWFILNSSTGQFTGFHFGQSGDRPAQGDFDNDGRADYCVFRDGIWYVQRSTAGEAIYHFGLPGDVPVTGDYDGDGQADVSVYRPSSGTWYLLQSTSGFRGLSFGTGDDRAVPSGYLPQ